MFCCPLCLLLVRWRICSLAKTVAAVRRGRSVRHFAESETTSQPPAALRGQWHGLRHANRERNSPNPALANFSSHACCHTGHTVTHIKTLEILKTWGPKQGLACWRRRPPLSSRPLYGNVWHWDHSFCCLCGSPSACVICKSSGYIHIPVARSGREGAWSSEFCSFLSGHGSDSSGGVWELEEENRGSASVGLGTY